MSMQPGFRILEHPSDIGIEARGESLARAFESAARGLMSVILDPSTVGASEVRKIHLKASDREQLLVRWLGEILYLYDGQEFASGEFSVLSCTETSLSADIRGETLPKGIRKTRMDVKAVTYHQLAVRSDENGVTVRVFLDI